MQLLYYGVELPQKLASLSRMERAQYGELWLSELSYLVDLQSIIEPAVVWLQDTVQPTNEYQFYVSEILYSYEGRWKIRNVNLRH